MGSTEQGTRFLLIAASLVIVIAGLRAAGTVVLPFLLALFLAIVTLPILVWLKSKRIPTAVAVLFTVLANMAALAAIVLIVSGSVQSFTQEAPKYAERLQEMGTAVIAWVESWGIDIPDYMPKKIINPGAVMGLVSWTVNSVAAVMSNIVLVLLIVIFVLFEITQFPAKLQLALGQQGQGSDNFAKIILEVQRYLGMKTLISLATGVLIGVWVAILGVDFPVLWGLIAFLFNYIPNIGSTLAAVPTVLLALVQLGPGWAALVGLGYVAVNVGMGTLLEPYLMGRTLGLSTLVIFLSLLFWGWLWGPMGMLLSVPLTMVIKILLENTEDFRWVAVLLGPSP